MRYEAELQIECRHYRECPSCRQRNYVSCGGFHVDKPRSIDYKCKHCDTQYDSIWMRKGGEYRAGKYLKERKKLKVTQKESLF